MTTLFGLQHLLHRYLSRPVTFSCLESARTFAQLHGLPFPSFDSLLTKHFGRLPLTIRAIPEGLLVPATFPVLTVTVNDPNYFWLASYLEAVFVRLWYPSTIAISSRLCLHILVKYLKRTSDLESPMDHASYMLHDFGARGVTCREQAGLGGAAHLLSFRGSDTMEGIRFANHYYDCDMAGLSIPASEHSTVMSWGKEGERDMYEKVVEEYLEGHNSRGIVACVIDTYNVYEAIKIWTSDTMKQRIKRTKGRVVLRPDSGDPVEMLRKVFSILRLQLAQEVKTNSKGYQVLPDWLRIIQGDGIDKTSIQQILQMLEQEQWSAENMYFGSGGGLLQKTNRDTMSWAMKCSAIKVDNVWKSIQKSPITDPTKKSRTGRLDVIRTIDGGYQVVNLTNSQQQANASIMQTVFHNGEILVHDTFQEIRNRMDISDHILTDLLYDVSPTSTTTMGN